MHTYLKLTEFKISIVVTDTEIIATLDGDRIPFDGSEDTIWIKGALDNIGKEIDKRIFKAIQEGLLTLDDPLPRVGWGGGDSFEAETVFLQQKHDMFISRVEKLMRLHYPKVFDFIAPHLLYPCNQLDYDEPDNPEHKAAEQRQNEAYDGLEKNGVTDLAWQAFLKEFFASPRLLNKSAMIKAGLSPIA